MYVNLALDDAACLLILQDRLSDRVRFLLNLLQAAHITSLENLSDRGAFIGSLNQSTR